MIAFTVIVAFCAEDKIGVFWTTIAFLIGGGTNILASFVSI